MRVLILAYPIIEPFANAFNCTSYTNSAGWIVGIYNSLVKSNYETAIVSPYSYGGEKKEVSNHYFYSIPKKRKDMIKFDKKLEMIFYNIIDDFKPEVILIFGTEYTQGYSMLLAAEKYGVLDRCVIFIQGLISQIKDCYDVGVPYRETKKKSIREIYNKLDIDSQKKLFNYRSRNEINMIKKVKHIIGGTIWDKRNVVNINPNIKYYFCPEILRNGFYNNKWEYEQCEKESILSVHSSFYPVKGIHNLIQGMYWVVKKYPNAKLYLTLNKPKIAKGLLEIINMRSYEQYVAKLIRKYKLDKNIVFLGQLNENDLIKAYLKANVFICSSNIENHSQAVSEAKILGVPTISSFVGGIVERIKHGEDGFFYQHNAPYMIVEYVDRIFSDIKLANYLSTNARENAIKLFDREINTKTYLKVFEDIVDNTGR